MKKLLLLAMTAAGAIVFKKKLDEQQHERDLWAEATDTPRSATGTGSGTGTGRATGAGPGATGSAWSAPSQQD